MILTEDSWSQLYDAVDDVGSKPSLSRIEGEDQYNVWKVYRVAGDIIRIDIKPKEKISGPH